MATDATAAKVICPYFRSSESRYICCDWIWGSNLSIRFPDKAARVAFQARVCCSFEHRRRCVIAARLYHEYEKREAKREE